MEMTPKQRRFYSAAAVGRIWRRLGALGYPDVGPVVWDSPAEIEPLLPKIADLFDHAIYKLQQVVKRRSFGDARMYIADMVITIKREWPAVMPEHRAYLRPQLRRFFAAARKAIQRKRGDILLEL